MCEIISQGAKLSQAAEKNQKNNMDRKNSMDLGTTDELNIEEENSVDENAERQLGQPTQEEVDIERSLIKGNQAVLCSADTGHL